MEPIFTFFTEEGNINNNKLFKAIQIFLIAIISCGLFKKMFGEYDLINLLDPNKILEFFLNGYFLAAIISYAIIKLLFIVIRIIFGFWYLFILVPKEHKTLEAKCKLTNEDINSLYLPFEYILQSIPVLGEKINAIKLFKKDNGRFVFDDDLGKGLRAYFDDPIIIIRNSLRIFEFCMQFSCAYFIATGFFPFPHWMSVLITILLFLCTGFLILILVYFSKLHVFIPALSKNEFITETELKEEKDAQRKKAEIETDTGDDY